MHRIITKRRMTFVAATVAAVALVSTAAGATRIGLPGSHSSTPAAVVDQWADLPAAPVVSGAGSLAATCVAATASRTAVSHRYDAVHRTWVVRVAKPLCAALYVQDAQYRKPLQGGRDYPQTLAATGKLIRMQAVGTYTVPLVARGACVQTDTGANWTTPPRWPPTLAGVGVPQPQQLSHWSVGPNTWSSSPPAACVPATPVPAPKVTVKCPADCVGLAQVTMSAPNPTTWLTLQIAPVLNGKLLHDHVLRLAPGKSGSVVFSAHDGDTITFGYVYSSTSKYPFKPFGHAVKVVCPPGAPPVVVTLSCPCAGAVTGSVQITNASRYALQVAVFVNGVRTSIVAVAARGTGRATLSMNHGGTATFGFRYNVTGSFPATFAPIQLKVSASG
jgi:hypothetical protein